MKTVWIVARHEVSLLRSEIIPVSLYFIMPLAILAFVQGAFTIFLEFTQPGVDANGADLAAPGLATMFGFMSLATFGFFFLGEHDWGTWDRVRSFGVRPHQIMTGKMAVTYVEQLLIFTFVMTAGVLLFDLSLGGDLIALVLIELVAALVVVGYGLIACALASTQAQFNAFAYLGALVMAGIGGALTPFDTLPGWAQAIAPAFPTYWAVQAFQKVMIDGARLSEVTTELLVLVVFAVGFLVLGSLLFESDKKRSTWA